MSIFEELAGRVMKAKLEGVNHVTLRGREVRMLYIALGLDEKHSLVAIDVTLEDIERWRKQILPDQV